MGKSKKSSQCVGGISRRGFLVAVGSTVVGRFFLPALSATAKPIEETAKVSKERVRQLLMPPSKSVDGDRFVLVWMESTPDEASPTVMTWLPETPEEIAEATRFYEAAHHHDRAPDAVEAREGIVGKIKRSARRLLATPQSAAEQALIEKILEDPENEASWLAYAAFLEKRGNPQGEFIRITWEIEHFETEDPRRAPLDERWGELVETHAEKWLAPLAELGLRPEVMERYFPSLWLIEGLVTELEIDKPGILPKRARQLFEAAPALMELTLGFDSPDVPAIVALPQLAQIRTISFSQLNLTDDDMLALVSSPNWRRLKKLILSFNSLTPVAVRTFATSPLFQQLECLHLSSCGLGDEVTTLLLEANRSGNLRELDLRDNQLTARTMLATGKLPHLSGMEVLSVSKNEIGAEGLWSLAHATFSCTLESLNLEECGLEPGSGATLAAGDFRSLLSLNIADNGLNDEDISNLAGSPILRSINELDLQRNAFGEEGARSLAASSELAALLDLDCSRCDLGDDGMKALAGWTGPSRVRKLQLRDNGFGPAATQTLARSSLLENIRELYLDNNAIGSAGALALAESPWLQQLKRLSLTRKGIGKIGMQALRKRFGESVLSLSE